MAHPITAADAKFVFGRLDASHVDGCAGAARAALASSGACEVCFQPGDGTHYGIVLLVIDERCPVVGAPGGGGDGFASSSALGIGNDRGGSYVLVTYVQAGRSFVIGREDFIHPSWLGGHLPDTSPASILALAVLLNAINGTSETWQENLVSTYAEFEAAR